MLTFLKKIAHLSSVKEVVLLSHQGNVLFSSNSGQQAAHFSQWKEITETLNLPQ